ncbi:MAG: TetR/AcrR family transcriptional regulator [Clostridia bacterium]|nr:TetR/AcrR family transcriptional regulator [Clostridia bacterium]
MNNIKNTSDKRVIRTKKAIREAFLKLLSERDLNDITVKALAECAGINRKTFYNYYSGIYQIIEELENDLVDKVEAAFAEVEFKKSFNDPSLIFDRINDMICADIDLYSHLFSMQSNLNIITKMTSLIKAKTKKRICLDTGIDDRTADVALEFAISGMVAAYQMWFRSDRSRPIEEVSHIIGDMSYDGMNGLIRKAAQLQGK